MRRALRVSAFRRLLAAYGLNELGWSVGTLALTVLVYRRTGSAIGAMAFFLCSQFLPALLTPALVARIDQRPPKRVLPALYGLEAILFGALAVMTVHFSLAAVLALTLVDGAVATAARALANATRAQVLKPADLLHEGNALINSVFSVCFFAGPLFGGAVVALGGTVSALLANCALLGIMAVVLATASLPLAASHEEPRSGRLRAGLAYARGDQGLQALLALHGIGLVCFTISLPVEIVFVSHSLHDGPAAYGALLSAWGGGAVAGSAIYVRWRRGRPATLITVSAAQLGVGFALMAVAGSLGPALVGAALAGIGNGIVSVSMQTAIQERTRERWMPLIMSLDGSIANLAPGVGILLGGLITALSSPRAGLATAAAGSLAFAALAWMVLRSVSAEPARAEPGEEPDGISDPSRARPESLV